MTPKTDLAGPAKKVQAKPKPRVFAGPGIDGKAQFRVELLGHDCVVKTRRHEGLSWTEIELDEVDDG